MGHCRLVGSSDRSVVEWSSAPHGRSGCKQGAGFRAVTSVWAFNGIYLESVSGDVRC